MIWTQRYTDDRRETRDWSVDLGSLLTYDRFLPAGSDASVSVDHLGTHVPLADTE